MRPSLAAVALVLLTGAGCGSARKSEPFAGPLELTEQELRGEAVFMRFCNECHPQGEASVGPSIHDKPLPGELIKLQVREGLGAMPSFGTEPIPDPDLEALVAYLFAMRDREAR